MVPTLKIEKDALRTNGFLNAFIKDLRKEEYIDDVVFLLFKPKNVEKFNDFLEREYNKNLSIVEDYDYENGYLVVVYKLDDKYKEDFNLIKKGRYSKTSEKFQKLFPEAHRVLEGGIYINKPSTQFRVFTKAEDLRKYWEEKLGTNFNNDMEMWEGFDIERETLDLDKIKQLI